MWPANLSRQPPEHAEAAAGRHPDDLKRVRHDHPLFLVVRLRDSFEALPAVEATINGNEEREAQKLCQAEKVHLVGINLVNKNRATTSCMYFEITTACAHERDHFKYISGASEIR